MKLSTWIERNVELPEGFVAQSGRMKLFAYQREIADAIGDPEIERVTVQKAARVGYTALLVGAIGYWCVKEPGPILCLLPVEADCKDFMTSDIETTFAASPALQSTLVDETRDGQRGRPLKGLQRRNTILARRFESGSLKIVPAKAPRNLRRHGARYLIIDESDAMENSTEGDVIALAEKRTLTFPNRKIIMGSTPVDEETSHVCEGQTLFAQLTAGLDPQDVIFRRDDGGPWGASHQQRPLEQASKVAKLDPPATFHILRHSYASSLAVPMGVIAAQLGHADTRMTEKHYAHLSPSYVADTVRAALPGLGIIAGTNVVSITKQS